MMVVNLTIYVKGPFIRTVSACISITITTKFTLTDRLGSEPNLSVKQSVTIGTMTNLDGDFDGHGHGDGTCKQALINIVKIKV